MDLTTTTYGLEGREIGFLTTELEAKYVGTDMITSRTVQ